MRRWGLSESANKPKGPKAYISPRMAGPMPRLTLESAESLARLCEGVLREAEPVKGVERGGVDLRKLDEAGTKFELVLTYIYRSGKLAKKEKTVIAVIPVQREVNGVFNMDLEGVVFRSLTFRKGNFEEEWSGSAEEVGAKFPEVAEAFKRDVEALLARASHS